MRMPYLDERWIVRETIRFLGDAELEYPDTLRRAISDAACAMAKDYERNSS